MFYVADISMAGQLMQCRISGADIELDETDTRKNITKEQYDIMSKNVNIWYYDKTEKKFKEGTLVGEILHTGKMRVDDIYRYTGSLKIKQRAEQARNYFSGGASPMEMSSWPRYLQMAEKFALGAIMPAEMIALEKEIELRARGETVAAFLEKIKVYDSRHIAICAVINGSVNAALDEIERATEAVQVEKVVEAFSGNMEALYAANTNDTGIFEKIKPIEHVINPPIDIPKTVVR